MIKQEHIQRTGRVRIHSLDEKPFAADLRTPRRQWPSQLVQRKYSGLAKMELLQPATCCCAGPVRDRHGRRFTTFPRGGTIKQYSKRTGSVRCFGQPGRICETGSISAISD